MKEPAIVSISTPISRESLASLRAGDQVLISGILYTARDAAHKRLCALLDEGKELPMDLKNHLLYYTGPTPAPEGMAVGSAGPTTAYRMDPYTPQLLSATGLSGLIGKGDRGSEGAVYFAAIGGAGALIGKCILSSQVVAFDDLGTEAIHCFTVRDFPVVVAFDSSGSSVYDR
jgi:fumarate hydratase subunit beta